MDRILIWGAGAIGGTLGAWWKRAGLDVTFVDQVAAHVEACRTTGVAIEGPVEEFTQIVPSATPDELKGEFPIIVLAVKAQATRTAAEQLKPHLAADGYVLSAQNGLNELAIAEIVGPERTMGCFVNFGADWLGPGRILYGNRGAVVIGEIDGSIRERTRAMHQALQIFEPDAVLTENIWGYLWGKLAYGAMLFATALTPDSMSANFADPAREKAFIALGREVMAAAKARNITPVGFKEFDPTAFMPDAPLAKARDVIASLADYTSKSAKTHSGVWRDLAVRKRKTEVDEQIGIIGKLGREAGVDAPAIRKLVELIHDVEDGRRPQSAETLKILVDAC
ncbi:ketopantoate reductase family protein [Terrarubrum flagellatum]|uniref:ketopantoate reductase family protein n=1 Tax=Terrirubrum flagellatum TaxID=2895980 RepID=UPI0031453369